MTERASRTSESSFFPSAPSSVSFTSKSWQLCPEEEGKPGTSAPPLSQRRGRDFDRGCQGNLTRQALCFIGVFKKCAAVALARVFRTSFCLLLDCYAWRRWHWNGMSHGGVPRVREREEVVRGKKTGKREQIRKEGWGGAAEEEESDPWPLRLRDVSGAGRGCNWEWHSWLELPNCHFLSSLFTHSRSLGWTFEECRTDMCLLVRPSLLTVIIVVHGHSINIEHRPPSARRGRSHGCGKWEKKPRDFGRERTCPF